MTDITRGSVVMIGKASKGVQRLAVVVQANAFRALKSVMVCPISPVQMLDVSLLRIPLDPTVELPLAGPSSIMAELLTVIARDQCGKVIGRISEEQQRALDRAIIVVAGIA